MSSDTTKAAALGEEGLVKRLRDRRFNGKWSDTLVQDPLCTEAADAIDRLVGERNAALVEVGNQARLRGEAEGALHVSELAGVVEGWQTRATTAESALAEARTALLTARDLAKTMEGLTACRSDDDYVWSAQEKIEAALRALEVKP